MLIDVDRPDVVFHFEMLADEMFVEYTVDCNFVFVHTAVVALAL